jgi:hypothetical protein
MESISWGTPMRRPQRPLSEVQPLATSIRLSASDWSFEVELNFSGLRVNQELSNVGRYVSFEPPVASAKCDARK